MATKEKEKKPAVKDGGGAKAPGAKSAQKAASKGKKGDAKSHGPHAGAGFLSPRRASRASITKPFVRS